VAVAVRKLFVLLLVVILVPLNAQDNKRQLQNAAGEVSIPAEPFRHELRAFAYYKQQIQARGRKIDEQGVLIETLDGCERLAEHNSETPFNPASVTKLATSLAALSRLGPDYRFPTGFLADGTIDPVTHRLTGDLVVDGNNDPMFSQESVQEVARGLTEAGISRVSGALRVSGSFAYFANGYHDRLQPDTSASKLLAGLRRAGIRIEGGWAFGERSGTPLLTHYSDELVRILLFQNAHSSNPVAEVVGAAVGGPDHIQSLLINNVGIPGSDVYISRASGLGFNRITPQGALRVLRSLIAVLTRYSLKPEDIMPVAGVDSGTLRSRFSADNTRGAIVAKTGTLSSMDGGVSTLVGIAHTRTGGTLLFAVFDSDGSVRNYRRLQDILLDEVIAEEGGGVPASRLTDALAGFATESIVQVHYRSGQPTSPEHQAD
jgi:D-alanyl-D-alanine carboxypeptidase/D-alanyl-D-alanine-endopeptidase (penicillin-binding protein 4)